MSVTTYPAVQLEGSKLAYKHEKFDTIKNIDSTKLTLAPTVNVTVEDKEVKIEIDGRPGIGLSGRKISDGRNLGPYIEELTYKIEPTLSATFLWAKPAGTDESEYMINMTEILSRMFSVAGTPISVPSGGGNYNYSHSFSQTVKEGDFDIETNREGSTIDWTKKINTCLENGAWNRYDPKNLYCLKTSYWHSRFWLNYKVDKIGDVPRAAKSSFVFTTEAKYNRTNPEKVSIFNINIQAKIAFVSNQMENHALDNNWTDDPSQSIHLVRATHQVSKVVKILPDRTSSQSDYRHNWSVIYQRRKEDYDPFPEEVVRTKRY